MLHIYRIRKGVPGVGRTLARRLAALGHQVQEVTSQRPTHSRIVPGDLVINYGRSVRPDWLYVDDDQMPAYAFLNRPHVVENCVDKLRTLTLLRSAGVPTVEWTVDQEKADNWLDDGRRVFVRHTTTGKKGQGIAIHEGNEGVPDAPLYTKEYRKSYEYRVHVFRSGPPDQSGMPTWQVIDITQKKKMSEEKLNARGYTRNGDIRNKANGWVFAHEEILDLPRVREVALAACAALGVDFAGVDVLAKKNGEAVVCEVNSAPGMSKKRTLDAYVQAFDRIARG